MQSDFILFLFTRSSLSKIMISYLRTKVKSSTNNSSDEAVKRETVDPGWWYKSSECRRLARC